MPLEVQSKLVRHLAHGTTLVSLDPHDEYVRGSEARLLELLGQVDLFLPSRQEATLLFGRDAPEDAALAFAKCGPPVVVIKLGADGSLVYGPRLERPVHVPAVDVNAIDPTGAGDAYCGAFCVSYGQAPVGGLVEAACRATVAASFVVERHGALAVLPVDCSVAEQRLERLTEEMNVSCAWTNAS
jgi:ribokinase